MEIHEDWVEAIRYLNMEVLKEQIKEQLRGGADSSLGDRYRRPERTGSFWRWPALRPKRAAQTAAQGSAQPSAETIRH